MQHDESERQLAEEVLVLRQRVAELEIQAQKSQVQSQSASDMPNQSDRPNNLECAAHERGKAALEETAKQLETNLAQLEAIVSSMTEGLTISDPRGNVVSMNPAALRIHKYHSVEEVRRHLEEFPDTFELSHLDGRKMLLSEWPLARALRGETFTNYEVCVRRADIDTAWICNYGGTPVRDRTGQIILALVTLRDVTQQKQTETALRESEERVQLATTAADIGMWFWNVAAGELIWTERCKAIFGLALDTEISYELFLSCLHPDDRDSTDAVVRRVLEEKIEYDIEYRTIWPDGSTHWIAAKGRGFDDADGKVVRMMGVAMDITKRKRVEAELAQLLVREQEAHMKAEAANRIKDEFLAVLSHELRTPLNPILGWIKLLRTRQLDQAKTDAALETIERNAKLQAQLVEDLLDVSRILQGKIGLRICPVNLVSTLTLAIETVQLAALAKSIQITTIFDSNVGSNVAQVLGDPTRLQQVVWNLLSNAVKFTPAGGRVEVRLSVVNELKTLDGKHISPSDNYAQIQVSDTGRGINPDFLPYVFEYFRQENSTTTRVFGGLGLGLAIVRHLVELHGGTVQAWSPGEGQGATFTVRLPLQDSQEEVRGDNSFPSLLPASFSPLEGIRVLVVDDNIDTLEFLTFLLEQEGAEVRSTASALEALDVFAQWQPDLLLSDIGMPDKDGYMLIRQIRAMSERGGQLPALALTAYAGEADRQQVLKAGFQKHLTKPVEPSKLTAAIISLVRRDLLQK